jgi:hypothetical protein
MPNVIGESFLKLRPLILSSDAVIRCYCSLLSYVMITAFQSGENVHYTVREPYKDTVMEIPCWLGTVYSTLIIFHTSSLRTVNLQKFV